jgi:hypothetical protein
MMKMSRQFSTVQPPKVEKPASVDFAATKVRNFVRIQAQEEVAAVAD